MARNRPREATRWQPYRWAWGRAIRCSTMTSCSAARIAGRYVHHTPNDRPGQELRLENGDPIKTPAETADVLRECGFWVLDELWPAEAKANCTNCYSGDHVGKPPPVVG